MIKYNTSLGSEHLNSMAREQRDMMKKQLAGMHCRKCNLNSEILFVEGKYGILYPVFNVCCPEFEERIRKALGFDNKIR